MTPQPMPEYPTFDAPPKASLPPFEDFDSYYDEEELQSVDVSQQDERDTDIRIWVRKGWQLYRQDWLLYSLVQAIILLGMFVAFFGFDYLLIINSHWSLLLAASQMLWWPLQFGIFIAGSHIVRQPDGSKKLEPMHFLKGYYIYLPLLVLLFVVEFVVSWGFLLFIVPGLYLGTTLCFSPLVYIEYHHDTNPSLSLGIFGAMAHSHRVVRRRFCKVFGFILLCFAINFVTFAFFFVGLVVSLPVCMLASVFAFRDLFQLHPGKQPDTHCYCC